MVSYSGSLIFAVAPISKSRVPPFSKSDRAACSRNIAAGPSNVKASSNPMRCATRAMCSQSALVSPGAGKNERWRDMRRSEFVTVPFFSPQTVAGSSTCAPAMVVSVCDTASDTTKRSSFLSAARMASARGNVTAGLVCMTQSALISPRSIASNIWIALRPSLCAMFGAAQKRRTRSTSEGEYPMCAANILASPPTSRPPIALGCPVRDSGPDPGLPMRAVAR